MTRTAEIVERLRRWASVSEPGGGLVSRDVLPVCTEAADHIETLARERDRAVEGLEPFADVGAWLFAIDAPDDTPLVTVTLINNAEGHLTRGMFKKAHLARAQIDTESEGER